MTCRAKERREKEREGTGSRPARPPGPPPFRKRRAPEGLQRGLFTLFLDDEEGQHICQVWASKPSSAASMMAPWSKGRLRAARREEEVPLELVGWEFQESPAALAEASGVPEDELDPGLGVGLGLHHVWYAEHEVGGRKSTLYVVETIGFDEGLNDEPPA